MTNTLPHALILAGGQSRRWQGQDKGLVQWQGMALIEHVAERLVHQVSHITISCNRNIERYQNIAGHYNRAIGSNSPLPACIQDTQYPQRGPLAGIYEYLHQLQRIEIEQRAAISPLLFICSCDTPLIPLNIVTQLDERMCATGSNATFPASQHSNYWLNLLINTDIAWQALQTLQDKALTPASFSVKNWLAITGSSKLPVSNETPYSNINSAADLEHLTLLQS